MSRPMVAMPRRPARVRNASIHGDATRTTPFRTRSQGRRDEQNKMNIVHASGHHPFAHDLAPTEPIDISALLLAEASA